MNAIACLAVKRGGEGSVFCSTKSKNKKILLDFLLPFFWFIFILFYFQTDNCFFGFVWRDELPVFQLVLTLKVLFSFMEGLVHGGMSASDVQIVS